MGIVIEHTNIKTEEIEDLVSSYLIAENSTNTPTVPYQKSLNSLNSNTFWIVILVISSIFSELHTFFLICYL